VPSLVLEHPKRELQTQRARPACDEVRSRRIERPPHWQRRRVAHDAGPVGGAIAKREELLVVLPADRLDHGICGVRIGVARREVQQAAPQRRIFQRDGLAEAP
jgi:hypothetical protein